MDNVYSPFLCSLSLIKKLPSWPEESKRLSATWRDMLKWYHLSTKINKIMWSLINYLYYNIYILYTIVQWDMPVVQQLMLSNCMDHNTDNDGLWQSVIIMWSCRLIVIRMDNDYYEKTATTNTNNRSSLTVRALDNATNNVLLVFTVCTYCSLDSRDNIS